jgi:hypothetical protein
MKRKGFYFWEDVSYASGKTARSSVTTWLLAERFKWSRLLNQVIREVEVVLRRYLWIQGYKKRDAICCGLLSQNRGYLNPVFAPGSAQSLQLISNVRGIGDDGNRTWLSLNTWSSTTMDLVRSLVS